MRIGIPTFGGDGGKSGISQYIVHLLDEFSRIADETRFDVFTYQDETGIFLPSVESMVSIPFGGWLRPPLINLGWHFMALPGWCRKRQLDVLFLPAGNRRLTWSAPCPTVGTVHDLSSIHVAGKYDRARLFYILKLLPILIRRLTHVITVSESSKRDLVEYARFPEERKGIERLFAALDRIDRGMTSATYFQSGQIGKGLWSSLKQFWVFFTVAKYWNASTEDLLDDYLRDEQLKTLFTQLTGFLGAEPDRISGMVFAMMWNSYHRGGYYYFVGGSQSVSDALAGVVRENGGEIRLSTRAEKIVIQDGRAVGVRASDGKTYPCRYVVSNANAPDTIFKLSGEDHLPGEYADRVRAMTIACSCLQIYMGVDADYSPFFRQGTHELMVNASDLQSENYGLVYAGDIHRMPFAVANYSMIDPTCAPQGKNVIVITLIMPYDWNHGWYEDEDYAKYTELKNQVAGVFVERAEAYLPGLSDHIHAQPQGVDPGVGEHAGTEPVPPPAPADADRERPPGRRLDLPLRRTVRGDPLWVSRRGEDPGSAEVTHSGGAGAGRAPGIARAPSRSDRGNRSPGSTSG